MANKINAINLKDRFHKLGYKYTEQRQMVVDVLFEHPVLHLSSEDICEYFKQKNINIGQSTVYRTLILLEKMQIVRSINLDDGFTRYELLNHDEEHAHHHLICSKCGSIIDIKKDLLKDLEKQIFKDYHFKVQDHCLKFYGECDNCKDKN